MSYSIIGTGPQIPAPFEFRVKTATEAQLKLRTTRELCGHALVRDAVGREIGEEELGLLVRQEGKAFRIAFHNKSRRWPGIPGHV